MARILVVDDDDDVRALAAEILREAGHEVIAAADGHQALAMLIDGVDVDVLFTDIMMPDVNGFELARRAAAQLPHLKILYTSGFAAGPPSSPAPPADLLAKPYRPSALLAAIGRLAGPAKAPRWGFGQRGPTLAFVDWPEGA
jgi:CheY-like chemotaxis protein